MLDRYPHDLNYLKARHADRLREAGIGRSPDQDGTRGAKERMFSLLGDVLINWGQRLKGQLEINALSKDCA